MKAKLRKAAAYSLPPLLGLIVGATVGKLNLFPEVTRQQALSALAWLPVVLFLVIAIHEVGHLLGGMWFGLRFCLLAVGPLLVLREQNRIRIKFNRAFSLWGGLAAALPERFQNLERAMLAFTAGGPLASLLAAVALWQAPGVAARLASLCSLLIGCVTLVPLRSSGFVSDGGRILMFLRQAEQAKRWSALALLSSYSLAMVRPREWPEEVIQQARAVPDGSPDDLAAAWLEHKAALDRGEIERARAALDYVQAHLDQLPKVTASVVLLDIAVFDGLYRHLPVQLPAAKPLFAPLMDFELARAASLLSQGDCEGAAQTARRALDRFPPATSGACYLTRDLLEEVVRQATR
ncbi:MAG: hypothetical protein NZV14_04605 [Bryobacteraceae bacterium]|nr:hypothetical protein [Bryobacteraceae bacterium]MDW8377414.1 hypothetical protein [Bryobacterales bacterium]